MLSPGSTEIDITEVINGLKQSAAGTAKLAETITLSWDEFRKVWGTKPVSTITEPNPAGPKDKAALEESMAASVKGVGSQIVPVAVGGFASIFFTELVDGVMIKQSDMTRGLVKGATAFAVYKWGKKIPFMGTTGKNIAAALIAFDALRSLTPISTWASKAANKVSGVIPVGGLGDQRGRETRALREATEILSSSQRMAMR